MSQVVSGVLEKLGDLLPNQIGTNRRWSTAAVTRHIMFADNLVREKTENRYHQQIIPLQEGEVGDVVTYSLDNE